tara:strand:- start:1340 stop:1828 length:489 start_codon:yes stop_codon:yes gene_type:complete
MAIGAQNLTITITEDFGTNQTGISSGTTATNLSTSIAEVVAVNDILARVISVLHTAEHTLYTTNDNGAHISGQQFDDENVTYARITNHDATNYVTLRLKNANDDEFSYKLGAGKSFILWGHLASMDATAGAAITLGSGDNDIVAVTAKANSGTCDVEVVVCS